MRYLALTIALLTASLQYGQDPADLRNSFNETSQLSSSAHVNQQIGITDIDIEYYRPNVNRRKVWGEMVIYGKVWRAGANFATTIELSRDVVINGNPLKAGKYALFVIPEKNEWTFIFDQNNFQFGAFFYNGKSDALRVTVPVKKTSYNVESLMYFFDNIVFDRGELFLAWGDKQASLEIATNREDIVASVLNKVKNAEKNKDYQAYLDAASWAIDHNMLTEKVRDWLIASLEIKESFGGYFIDARLDASQGNYSAAVHKTKEIAQKFPFFKPVTDQFIQDWSSKL